jgi:hypothetical protein
MRERESFLWVKILGNRLANRGFPPRKLTGTCRLTLRTDLVDGTVLALNVVRTAT